MTLQRRIALACAGSTALATSGAWWLVELVLAPTWLTPRLMLIVVGTTSVVIAWSLGWVAASWAVRPVARMHQQLQNRAPGDDAASRVEVPADAALARLALAINEVAREVESSQRAQRRAGFEAQQQLLAPVAVLRQDASRLLHEDLSSTDTCRLRDGILRQIDALTEGATRLVNDDAAKAARRV